MAPAATPASTALGRLFVIMTSVPPDVQPAHDHESGAGLVRSRLAAMSSAR
jgi:hypothetical protein